jgi:phosphoenolpyruvate carboxykinase (ATP)
MKIGHTRAMIHAALSGALDSAGFQTDPLFNLEIPKACPDVPANVLQPKTTWSDKSGYDAQAKKLAGMFGENFRAFEGTAAADVKNAGPRV